MPIKLWYAINYKMHPNFRDVKMWKICLRINEIWYLLLYFFISNHVSDETYEFCTNHNLKSAYIQYDINNIKYER